MKDKYELIREALNLPSYDCVFCGMLDSKILRVIMNKEWDKLADLIELKKKHIEEKHKNDIPLGTFGELMGLVEDLQKLGEEVASHLLDRGE